MRNISMGFPTSSDTTRTVYVQLQSMARGLKLWVKKVEGLFYPCCTNEDVDQLPVTPICAFAFRICKKQVFTTRLIHRSDVNSLIHSI